MVSNGKLYTTVMEKLNFEPRLDDSNIAISIKGNHDIVVLDGKVKSFSEKLIAENAAKSVHGVKAVVNEITVEPSLEYKRTDAEIATEAIRALKSTVWVPAEKIQTVVKDGNITLSGEVEWQYEKSSAFSAVKNLRGVKVVINNITVKPAIAIKEDKVKQEIIKEFERHARLDASKIKITVQGRTVSLDGEVANFDEQEIAENAAWSIPGVAEVKNNLEISYI